MGGGPPPAIRGEAEAALRRMLSGSDNHLTLAECRDRLAAEAGLRVHPWTVGRALRRMLSGSDDHLTLAECRDRLAAETGLRAHPWTVGRALRRMGWT